MTTKSLNDVRAIVDITETEVDSLSAAIDNTVAYIDTSIATGVQNLVDSGSTVVATASAGFLDVQADGVLTPYVQADGSSVAGFAGKFTDDNSIGEGGNVLTIESDGTSDTAMVVTQNGNAYATRWFDTGTTSINTLYASHNTSAKTGNFLTARMAFGSGTFTGNFIDFWNNTDNVFVIDSTGAITSNLSLSGTTTFAQDAYFEDHLHVKGPMHFHAGNTPLSGHGYVIWDDTYKTLAVGTGLGNIVQLGQELWGAGKNNTGSPVYDGNVVYLSGASDGIPTFDFADATGPATSASGIIGVITAHALSGGIAPVTVFGIVNNMDTSEYLEGDELFLTTNPQAIDHLSGSMTTVAPSYPNHKVRIGSVLTSHATSGQIFVHPQHDVHHWLEHIIDSRAYGGLSIDGNTDTMTASASPGWGHIHDFDNISPYTNTTPSTADGSITVGLDGDYMVQCPLSVLNGAQADDFLFRVFVDDVGIPSLTFARTFGGADTGSGMISGIISLTAGQEVDLRVQADVADRTITVEWANLTVNRVSIT